LRFLDNVPRLSAEEVEMRRGFRIALVTAAVAAGLAFAGASPAQAQVPFRGSFALPHGRISIGFGDRHFRVGSYAPSSYRVYAHPRYGYGFPYRSRWIPVRRYRSRWVVVARPVVVDPYYSVGPYYTDGYFRGGYSGYGYSGFRRYRSFDRDHGRGFRVAPGGRSHAFGSYGPR
jgi:hypothetical protein